MNKFEDPKKQTPVSSVIDNNQDDYVNVDDLLEVLKSKNKPLIKTKFNLTDLSNNPLYLERDRVKNMYINQESEKIISLPKVSLTEMIEANETDAQVLLATLKEKNKNFLDKVLN